MTSSGPEGQDGDEPVDDELDADASDLASPSVGSARPSATERTWIHPAELPSRQAIATPVRSARSPRWVQVVLGVAAASLLLVGVSFLSRSLPPTDSQTTVLSASRLADAPTAIGRTARAMVVLTITSSKGSETTPGIALVSRRVITTTATIPSDALVYADDLEGHPVTATSYRTDATVGLTALVFAVPVVRQVADVATESARGTVTAISLSSTNGAQPVRWAAAHVRSTDALVTKGGRCIGSVTGTSPLSEDAGTVLASTSGRAEAISSPSLATDAYLPATFASSLSGELVSMTSTTHGRLGISGTTAPQGGSEVVAVAAGGPAAGILEKGDVILGVNGATVSTAAEMVDDVYLQPAGATLDLTVRRGHTISTRAVTLEPTH